MQFASPKNRIRDHLSSTYIIILLRETPKYKLPYQNLLSIKPIPKQFEFLTVCYVLLVTPVKTFGLRGELD